MWPGLVLRNTRNNVATRDYKEWNEGSGDGRANARRFGRLKGFEMRRGVIPEIFKHSVCQVYRRRRTTKGCAASMPKYRTVADKTMPSANPWLSSAPSTSSTNKEIRHFWNKMCARFYRGFGAVVLDKKKRNTVVAN